MSILDISEVIMKRSARSRNEFIGGSDARIIMGKDEKALKQLWHQKRGEAEGPDLSAVPGPRSKVSVALWPFLIGA
jgi:predicted phage-related endonuclease